MPSDCRCKIFPKSVTFTTCSSTKSALQTVGSANTMKVAKKTAAVKCSKKKDRALKASQAIGFKGKGQAAKSYKGVSGPKKITINKTTGNITVKKGLKNGAYKVKVKVTAARPAFPTGSFIPAMMY